MRWQAISVLEIIIVFLATDAHSDNVASASEKHIIDFKLPETPDVLSENGSEIKLNLNLDSVEIEVAPDRSLK